QDSDDMRPLLPAHCEWPGGHGHGAADQRDECASLHVLPPPEGNTLPHRDAALCSTAKAIAEWSKWVKMRRTQFEQKMSAFRANSGRRTVAQPMLRLTVGP